MKLNTCRWPITFVFFGFMNFGVAQNQPTVQDYNVLSVLEPDAFGVIDGGRYQWAISDTRLSRSSDFGKTWTNLDDGNNKHDLSFVNKDLGYIVGQNGTVYKTTDGGESITDVFNLSSEVFSAVSFISENEGWVGGQTFGDIYHTSDGGQNWFAQSLTTDGYIINSVEIKFIGQTGHVLVNKSTIGIYTMYNTINGGTSWNQSDVGTEELTSMDFIGSNIWAGGGESTGVAGEYSDAVIYKSIDGGASWTKSSLGVESKVIDISFADDQYGWLSLSNGALYQTVDGGVNWEEFTIESDFQGNWNSQYLVALDTDHLWLTVLDQNPPFPVQGAHSALIGNIPRVRLSFRSEAINSDDELSITNYKDAGQIDSIYLVNRGQKDLTVSEIDFSNTDLSHSISTPLNIAAGDSIELTVDVSTMDVGQIELDLTVTSNDELEEVFTVSLILTVINPEIEITFDESSINDGDTITFEATAVGLEGNVSSNSVAISNTGETELEAQVTPGGDFDIDGTGIYTLDAASEGTIITLHEINVAGKRNGTITIKSNDFDEEETTVYLSTCVNPVKPTITVTELENSVQLTASSTSGNEWYVDSSVITGETGETLEVTEGGDYQVKSTVDGCSSELSEVATIVITNIENNIGSQFELFPTLAKDRIHFDTKKVDDFGKIMIYDAIGIKRMERGVIHRGKNLIEIHSLPPGMYFLFYKSGENFVKKRFVKL